MPIDSPVGPLSTLEEIVAEARTMKEPLEDYFQSPVMLVVAPSEAWGETTAIRLEEAAHVSVTMMPTLVVPVEPRGRGKKIVTFGRSDDNDVALPFVAISKSHGCFRKDDAGEWSIEDVGSKNGTYVDGKRVSGGPTPLRAGATLRFGDVSARFLLPAAFCDNLRRRLNPPPAP